jgi:hypothetical protein
MPMAHYPPSPSLREAKANCWQALVDAKAADPRRRIVRFAPAFWRT